MAGACRSKMAANFSPCRIEEVLLFWVPLDVSGEERTDRNDAQATLARRAEREADQRRADALAFVRFGHLGVREGDRPRIEPVLRDAQAAVAEIGLEAVFFRIVDDCEVGRCISHSAALPKAVGTRQPVPSVCAAFPLAERQLPSAEAGD